MLMKRRDGSAGKARLQGIAAGLASGVLDRRTFLRRSGLAAGAGAALGLMPLGSVRKAEAGPQIIGAPTELKKNICTHCSVGCTVIAEVQNGVWVGQEPAWDSPINRGSHCAKGAAVRELVHGDRRLKWPMKLVNGEWQKISWDTAINEIGDKMLEIRAKSGADSVYLLGSAKFSNEGGYLFRKFAAFWGTNSIDHQARICHSTTVAGVANTWGYGAMTNSYNDMRNSKTIVFMGSNAAEAHPVSLQHILTGKEINRANVFVLDPRFTRTAAHATEYVRFRSGTDIAVIWGMLHHIFNNGWEDKEYIKQRVYGMDQIRAECRQMDAGRGRARHRDSRRAAEEGRRDLRQAEAVGLRLVHGRHPAHRRHRQRPRLLQPAAGDRQCRHLRRRRQHLPRPLQRAGRHRYRPRYRDAAALLRPGRRRLEALGPGLGSRIRLSAVALRRSAGQVGSSCAQSQGEHGNAGHPVDPLVRCDARQSR